MQLKKFLSWGYFALISSLLLTLCAVFGGLLILYIFSRDLPEHKQLINYSPNLLTRVFSSDGKLIAEYAIEKRVFLPVGFIPDKLKNAFLAAEDKNFYHHHGVDPSGIMRAVAINIIHIAQHKRLVGASTITQQVAKLFFTGNEISYKRKLKEAILAIRLESSLGKDKILELYLNQIYLGHGAYGVAMAAKRYFNKSVEDLTIAECAYLAALAKGANNYHPIKNKARAIERRNWVIDRELAAGFINRDEADEAKSQDLIASMEAGPAATLQDSYFVEEVRRSLAKQFSSEKLYNDGLIVRTTEDTRLQALAEKSLRDGLLEVECEHYSYNGPISNVGEDFEKVNAFTSPTSHFQVAVITKIQKDQVEITLQKTEKKQNIPIQNLSWAIREQIEQAFPKGMVVAIAEKGDEAQLLGIYDSSRSMVIGSDGNIVRSKTGVTLASIARSGSKFITMKAGDKWFKIMLEDMSEFVEKIVRSRFAVGDVIYVTQTDDGTYSLVQIPRIQGAILIMDPHDGSVKALSGGFDFNMSEFDRSMQAKPQIGSLIKPFIYMAALNRGLCPATQINARYIAIDLGKSGIWEPKNYGMATFKDVSLRSALEKSINTATVRVARYAGLNEIRSVIEKFGILDYFPENISFILGACNASTISVAKAFGMIANGGHEITPHLIDIVQDKYGKVIYKSTYNICNGCASLGPNAKSPPTVMDDSQQVIDNAVVYQMQTMLEGVIKRGSGRRAKNIPYSIAGKTGTSNDNKAVWFVGLTPDIVAVVFVARDDSLSLGHNITGSNTALPIFIRFINQYIEGKIPRPFKIPPNVRIENFVDDSGTMAQEVFKEGDDVDFYPDPDDVNLKELDVDLDYVVRRFKMLYQ